MKTWYHKWHNHKYHPHIHWGTLVAICLLAGNFLIGQINSAYQFDVFEIPVVKAQITEGGNAYFDYQVDNRPACNGSTGPNCIVQVTDCVSTAPGDNGACSLRNDTQLATLSNSQRTLEGWFYLPNSDNFITPQDAAKVVIEAGDTDVATQDHLLLTFPATPQNGTFTAVWDTWWDPRWMRNECGGGFGSGMSNLKTWRLDRLGDEYYPTWNIAGNPKVSMVYAGNWDCSENALAVHAGGLVMNAATVASSYSLVSPVAIGHTTFSGDANVAPSGNGGVYNSGGGAGGYMAGLLRVGTWTRLIYHTEWNVPGNSKVFAPWRADCDSAGVNTMRDQVCANMLNTLAAVDPDCAVEDAPGCDSTWSAISLWSCEEARGCQRIYHRVPWHNFGRGGGMYLWIIEYDSSQNSCTNCTDRVVYERNNFMVHNINSADIDDTGCPLNCPGDLTNSNSNIFRRPIGPSGRLAIVPPPAPAPAPPPPSPTPAPTPTPPPPVADPQIVLDNSNATTLGTWNSSNSIPGFYGSDYLHDKNSVKGANSVKFTPNITTSGNYEVYARWLEGSNFATNVPIEVIDQSGSKTYFVNQRNQGGGWVLLGTHSLSSGTGNSVTIKNDGTTGTVIADAVGFTLVSSQQPLRGDLNNDGIVNSIDWSIMNSKWFTSDANADLNQDGIVNSIDFSLMNANWLRTSG